MPKEKRNGLAPLDTSVHRPTTGGEGSAVIDLRDVGGHIGKLKQVSFGTQKLVKLLVDQLEGLSWTIPVLQGSEIVRI